MLLVRTLLVRLAHRLGLRAVGKALTCARALARSQLGKVSDEIHVGDDFCAVRYGSLASFAAGQFTLKPRVACRGRRHARVSSATDEYRGRARLQYYVTHDPGRSISSTLDRNSLLPAPAEFDSVSTTARDLACGDLRTMGPLVVLPVGTISCCRPGVCRQPAFDIDAADLRGGDIGCWTRVSC